MIFKRETMKLTLFLLIIFITHANIKAQNYTFSKDNCIELSQNQMEEFGFIFKKNEIIYKSRDEELFYTFIIKKGNVETIIDIKSEENDTIKYTNNITPYFVSNENLKLFHSRNVLNQELIPIIINNSIKNH